MSKFRYLEKEFLHGGVSDSSDEDESDVEENVGKKSAIENSKRFDAVLSKLKSQDESSSDEEDDDDEEGNSGEGGFSDSDSDRGFDETVDSDDDQDDEEVLDDEALAKLRSGPLGDVIKEDLPDGSTVFKCKFCADAVMKSEAAVASHLQGKKHRKSFLKNKKAQWTPEMIEAKRQKNRLKRQRRNERLGVESSKGKKNKKQKKEDKDEKKKKEQPEKKVKPTKEEAPKEKETKNKDTKSPTKKSKTPKKTKTRSN